MGEKNKVFPLYSLDSCVSMTPRIAKKNLNIAMKN